MGSRVGVNRWRPEQPGRPAAAAAAGLVRRAEPHGTRGGSVRRTRLQGKTIASRLNPYLKLNGNASQALELYASVFGGGLSLSTFAEFGVRDSPDADRIMHGMLETDAGYTIMGADITSDMDATPWPGPR